MIRIPIKAKVRIDGIPYAQYKATILTLNEGDLVLDTKDNCYGYVDSKLGDKIAIRHGCTVEIGIPINRVRKLIPTLTNKLIVCGQNNS